MKIAIVNILDSGGGAARAAYRLHECMLQSGVDSTFFVQTKKTDNKRVITGTSKSARAVGLLRPVLDQLPKYFYPKRKATLFSVGWLSSRGLVKKINALQPDVVHLHWVAGGMLNSADLQKIHAPIVWSLHDMAPFTGGCHYTGDCIEFQKKCGNCPQLGSRISRDLSYWNLEKKRKKYSRRKITFVGLSKWIAGEAKKSTVLNDKHIVNLPNPINTNVFAPLPNIDCKKFFNLPPDKKIIMFGAIGATSDLRKGWSQLKKTIELLDDKDYHFAIFGSSGGSSSDELRSISNVTYLGILHDDISLRIAYCCADVFVLPSLQENLANTAMEALACGIPVVGFNIGGNNDLIIHRETGYLVEPFNSKDFKSGIEFFCRDTERTIVEKNCVDFVTSNFGYDVLADAYRKLYNETLNKKK